MGAEVGGSSKHSVVRPCRPYRCCFGRLDGLTVDDEGHFFEKSACESYFAIAADYWLKLNECQ